MWTGEDRGVECLAIVRRADDRDTIVAFCGDVESAAIWAIGEIDGFVKLIIGEPHGEILGAHIIGAEATELIAELGLAITLEATYEEIEATIHAHPTLSEMVHEATSQAFGHAIHI